MAPPIGGFSIFDDKGDVKRLVEAVIQQKDPNATIEQMRKIDFSYVFVLSKRQKTREVQLNRDEIDAKSHCHPLSLFLLANTAGNPSCCNPVVWLPCGVLPSPYPPPEIS